MLKIKCSWTICKYNCNKYCQFDGEIELEHCEAIKLDSNNTDDFMVCNKYVYKS